MADKVDLEVALEIALKALGDIAGGFRSCSPSDAMLGLPSGRGSFHEAFGALLQSAASNALSEIDKLGVRL